MTPRADIQKVLWNACDSFRGKIDSSRYKDYILSMLFVKYLSDVTKEKREKYMQQYAGDERRVERAMSRERFVMDKNSTFDYLYENRNDTAIGEKINIALANIEKNNSFYWCIQYLNEVLYKCNCKYAMLKGAYLCHYYPKGYRTSSDIDLLVKPEDVTQIGNALSIAGFKQGNIRNGNFIPATRKEIIESKMLRGETVPYIKELNFPNMKYLEVDINFSLDYKNSSTDALESMLEKASKREIRGADVTTLDESDFFIHLCAHLYKEASTLPWVEIMRDMTLYKYCDIYLLLEDMTMPRLERIFERATELGIEKECAFTIIQTAELFDITNNVAVDIARSVLINDSNFVHRVIDPKENKTYIFTEKNIFERFFADSRKDLLKEEI